MVTLWDIKPNKNWKLYSFVVFISSFMTISGWCQLICVVNHELQLRQLFVNYLQLLMSITGLVLGTCLWHTYLVLHICIHAHTTCMYVHTIISDLCVVCTCVCVYMCVCITYTRMYTYTHTHTRMYTLYTYICMHAHVHNCVLTCI